MALDAVPSNRHYPTVLKAMNSVPRLETGAMVGPYRIDRLIGTGGMGEVYSARDTNRGRDVAIKVLPKIFTSDPDRVARFQREARLLAALNHPHIGEIYGFPEAEGVRALVLELVEGQTLADRLASGPLPLNETLTMAGQIAEALAAAHARRGRCTPTQSPSSSTGRRC